MPFSIRSIAGYENVASGSDICSRCKFYIGGWCRLLIRDVNAHGWCRFYKSKR